MAGGTSGRCNNITTSVSRWGLYYYERFSRRTGHITITTGLKGGAGPLLRPMSLDCVTYPRVLLGCGGVDLVILLPLVGVGRVQPVTLLLLLQVLLQRRPTHTTGHMT